MVHDGVFDFEENRDLVYRRLPQIGLHARFS